MPKRAKLLIFLTILLCFLAGCGRADETTSGRSESTTAPESSSHTYASVWSYDDTSHWHACLDKGYESLKADEALHSEDNEVILKEATDTETGLGEYTCSVCGHTYQKVIKIATSILSLPAVEDKTVYIGQSLSALSLLGGEGSVAGHFVWTDPDEIITQSGAYRITFEPEDDDYAPIFATVHVTAEELTLSVTSGENGKANVEGTKGLLYGGRFTVIFTPDVGYAVDSVTVDGENIGAVAQYTFDNITENHTVSVTFREYKAEIVVNCIAGTPGCYTIAGTTLTFTALAADSVYSIEGLLEGSIVIDVGDDYRFELELCGLTLTGTQDSPITVLSGDKVTLTAKKNYENSIIDKREAIPEDDETQHSAAIYSLVDLVLGGKGSLTLVSENNNGIHTKDDLEVKNLTLSVTCQDNALKGNDSVTLTSGVTTLIARAGDGIKTPNSNLSDKGSQRGTITVSGGEHTVYAACDGLDAAYDVVIANDNTVLNIYTDRYSDYSEEVTDVSDTSYYIRFTSQSYRYSVKYYNSGSDYLWVNATYHSTVSSGRSNYYYYSFQKNNDYSKMQFFIYSSDMALSQEDEYLACSDYLTPNAGYDTFALQNSPNGLSYSWTNYTTSIQDGPGGSGGGPGGMGGMNDGNPDKGDYSTKGIKAANAITVNGGTITVKAYDDAIHANNDSSLENGAAPTGNVSVNGGSLTLFSNDDGIHADGTLTITNGSVNITNCYEGLEGNLVHIEGGSTSIQSSDDGINSPAASGEAIVIRGGTLYIDAGGDGIDSNSRTAYSGIVFSGGHTIVITTSGGNSAIDTEQGYSYTGGSVAAIMPSNGMTNEATHCQNFASIATNKTVLLSAGKYLTISANGKEALTLQIPTNLSARVIYLGTPNASFETESATDKALDANGVWWNSEE